MIESIFPYSVLTDTVSICIFFIFTCNPSFNVPNENFFNVLFEVIINNKVLNRFNTFHKFWDGFNVRNTNLRKTLGYFAIENIGNPCFVTAVQKEYFEQFESGNVNKKHKGLRKGVSGMEFENYSRRINSVYEIESFGQTINEKLSQFRFSVKKKEMVLEQIEKCKFA